MIAKVVRTCLLTGEEAIPGHLFLEVQWGGKVVRTCLLTGEEPIPGHLFLEVQWRGKQV